MLCESECDKKWKTCKCTSIIPYMWFPNVTKQIAPCSNWCQADGWIHIFTTQVRICMQCIWNLRFRCSMALTASFASRVIGRQLEKLGFLIDSLNRHHIYIYVEFSSQKCTCSNRQVIGNQLVAWHENVLAPGVLATDFSSPAAEQTSSTME